MKRDRAIEKKKMVRNKMKIMRRIKHEGKKKYIDDENGGGRRKDNEQDEKEAQTRMESSC
jgi:hypothetical protein